MENNNQSIQLFADDTSLFSVVHDINTSTIEWNSDLKKKNQWSGLSMENDFQSKSQQANSRNDIQQKIKRGDTSSFAFQQ